MDIQGKAGDSDISGVVCLTDADDDLTKIGCSKRCVGGTDPWNCPPSAR